MEFNLSPGGATVVLSGMGLVWGIIMKIFPKKDQPQVLAGFMKSQEVFSAEFRKSTESSSKMFGKMHDLLISIKDKTDGSHEKLNIMMPSTLRVHNIEESVNELRLDIASKRFK